MFALHLNFCVWCIVCAWYSELPLIRTPEMWPPQCSGHSEKSQSMLYSTNSPLKCDHPSNQYTLSGPKDKGGRISGSSLYVYLFGVF